MRGEAARVLAISDDGVVSDHLLKQFFSQEGKDELWATALTLERFGDARSVGPLVNALNDLNHHRRHAAALSLLPYEKKRRNPLPIFGQTVQFHL